MFLDFIILFNHVSFTSTDFQYKFDQVTAKTMTKHSTFHFHFIRLQALICFWDRCQIHVELFWLHLRISKQLSFFNSLICIRCGILIFCPSAYNHSIIEWCFRKITFCLIRCLNTLSQNVLYLFKYPLAKFNLSIELGAINVSALLYVSSLCHCVKYSMLDANIGVV